MARDLVVVDGGCGCVMWWHCWWLWFRGGGDIGFDELVSFPMASSFVIYRLPLMK